MLSLNILFNIKIESWVVILASYCCSRYSPLFQYLDIDNEDVDISPHILHSLRLPQRVGVSSDV
jgi:hypothetical protein